jgi:hypothetical protein
MVPNTFGTVIRQQISKIRILIIPFFIFLPKKHMINFAYNLLPAPFRDFK